MKLFDDNEQYTEDGHQFSQKVGRALQPIIDEYLARGAKTREMDYIASAEVNILTLGALARQKIKNNKE